MKWPMLDYAHLRALMFAYNEGYSKAIDGRKFKNPFSPEGSQAAAWALGTADGAEARGKMASAPVALPAGYALVPIEPTPEMIEAGATERITPHASAGHGAVAGYKAMLAAAPVASAPVADERAAFEAARQKRDADARLGRMCLVNNDEYSNSEDQAAWEGWQDRAALASAPVAGEPDWANRRTDSLAGWINELGTLSQHRSVKDHWLRNAMRTIYDGLSRYAAPQASEASIPGMREAARLLRERASDLENCICAHDSKADARALRTAAHHLRRVARSLAQQRRHLDTGPTEPDNGGD